MSTTPTPAARGEAKGGAEAPASEAKATSAPSGGVIKAFLPLIIAIVAMPALAFVTTNFLILPKIKAALGQGASSAPETGKSETASSKEGDKKEGDKKEGSKEGGKSKITVPITKILVNVSGTMGTRYLMTSLTVVGSNPDLKAKIEDNKDQLLDLATSTLSSKTIADLEKPGARNIIRNELMAVFNNALGSPLVQEIYITEMAIQ